MPEKTTKELCDLAIALVCSAANQNRSESDKTARVEYWLDDFIIDHFLHYTPTSWVAIIGDKKRTGQQWQVSGVRLIGRNTDTYAAVNLFHGYTTLFTDDHEPLSPFPTPSPTWSYYDWNNKPQCPECQNGKHRNCTEQALDPVSDNIVACGCPNAEHNKENQ